MIDMEVSWSWYRVPVCFEPFLVIFKIEVEDHCKWSADWIPVEPVGETIQFDEYFQKLGWFNHQLDPLDSC